MVLRRGDSRSGQAAVEMALTMPLVFALIMGVLELGVAFHAFTTVTAAAREGARAGAIYLVDPLYSKAVNDVNREIGVGTTSPYTDNIRDTVDRSLGVLRRSPPHFDKTDSAHLSITYAAADPALDSRQGDLVTVTVMYRHYLISQILGQPRLTLTAQASARIE